MMKMPSQPTGFLLFGLVMFLVSGCAGSLLAKDETPGEHFDRAMQEFADKCARVKLKPNDTACDILKLKPADPLVTEEGRFAHSIKIPNPIPEDSGYKPGMTSQEYFNHLCKTEAGEFIYKTVENVEGLYIMRPRQRASDYEQEHLYALEDPYGHEDWEASDPGGIFVSPASYKFVEMPATKGSEPQWRKQYVHPSLMTVPPSDARIQRYFGYDGRNQKSLQMEYDVNRRSGFGYTWRGIHRPHDRELGITGGEVIVMDLETNEVLAVRRGFMRSGGVQNLTGIWWPRGQVCRNDPERVKLVFTAHFLSKVLKPGNVTSKEKNDATK